MTAEPSTGQAPPAWAEPRHRITSVWGRQAWQRPVGEILGAPTQRATVSVARVDDERTGPGEEIVLIGGYRLDPNQARHLARLLTEAARLLDGRSS